MAMAASDITHAMQWALMAVLSNYRLKLTVRPVTGLANIARPAPGRTAA